MSRSLQVTAQQGDVFIFGSGLVLGLAVLLADPVVWRLLGEPRLSFDRAACPQAGRLIYRLNRQQLVF